MVYFPNLLYLNISFNLIEEQHNLEYAVYLAKTQKLRTLDITGNPLACDPMNYAELSAALASHEARLISELLIAHGA